MVVARDKVIPHLQQIQFEASPTRHINLYNFILIFIILIKFLKLSEK